MKAKFFLAIVGTIGLGAASFGQGVVVFDNYACTPYYPVVYRYGVLQGTGAGGNVSVELGYALGANQTMGFTLIPSSITAINPSLYAASNNGSGPLISGWFMGGVVTIPDYASGPISFEILAWTTDHGTTYANAAFNGYLMWTEPSINISPTPAGYFTALPGPILMGMPEPSTLALAGLGGLASLLAFHRKQSKTTSP